MSGLVPAVLATALPASPFLAVNLRASPKVCHRRAGAQLEGLTPNQEPCYPCLSAVCKAKWIIWSDWVLALCLTSVGPSTLSWPPTRSTVEYWNLNLAHTVASAFRLQLLFCFYLVLTLKFLASCWLLPGTSFKCMYTGYLVVSPHWTR